MDEPENHEYKEQNSCHLIGEMAIGVRERLNKRIKRNYERPDADYQLSQSMTYFALALGYYHEMRLSEVRFCLERAIEEDTRELGKDESHKSQAWEMYQELFTDDNDPSGTKLRKIIIDSAKKNHIIMAEVRKAKRHINLVAVR